MTGRPVQAVLCDICEQPIRGSAFEIHFIHGHAVHMENGSSRIVERDGATMMFMCERSGTWTQDAVKYLRRGFHGAGGRAVDEDIAEHLGSAASPKTSCHEPGRLRRRETRTSSGPHVD